MEQETIDRNPPEIMKTLTLDYPEIRLNEHDRSCAWCAQHPEGCLRRQVLKQAVEEIHSSRKNDGN